MKKTKLIKIITAIAFFTCINNISPLAVTTTRDGTINSNMNSNSDNFSDTLTYEAWHYPGGYWQYVRRDIEMYTIVKDGDTTTFSGTSKELDGGDYKKTFMLSSDAQQLISCYGANKLGLKFNVGGDLSVKNKTISYTIDSNSITVRYSPILNYVRPDMWQKLNDKVASAMETKNVYTPQILSGYGYNYLAVGEGNKSIVLTEERVKNAYKGKSGGTDVLWVDDYWVYWAPFSAGGNNGVSFQWPLSINVYTMGVQSSAPVISGGSSIYKNGAYWIRQGDSTNIIQRGSSTGTDNLVKATNNALAIRNGSKTNSIDNKILASDSSSTYFSQNTTNIGLDMDSTKTVRSGNEITTTSKVIANAEGTYTIGSATQLINYTNYSSNPAMYKSSPTQNITAKVDGSAPDGTVKIKTNTRDKATISIENYTDGTGVGVDLTKTYIQYSKDGESPSVVLPTRVSGTNVDFDINYDGTYKNKYGDYKVEVYTVDLLGNMKLLETKNVYREYPCDILSMTNTYRVPSIGKILTSPVNGQVSAPLKIFSGIKTSMTFTFRGAAADFEFYDQYGNPITGIEFESSNTLYNHDKINKYTEGSFKEGDKITDNVVSFLGDENASVNTVSCDFYLPNTVQSGRKITIKGIAYSKDINKVNTDLGLFFYEVRGDARKFISVNNIR